jgi:hypothetical protein
MRTAKELLYPVGTRVKITHSCPDYDQCKDEAGVTHMGTINRYSMRSNFDYVIVWDYQTGNGTKCYKHEHVIVITNRAFISALKKD